MRTEESRTPKGPGMAVPAPPLASACLGSRRKLTSLEDCRRHRVCQPFGKPAEASSVDLGPHRRRSPHGVMGVRCHVVGEALTQELDCHSPRRAAEAADEAAGGDRHEGSAFDQRYEGGAIAMKGLAALWMGDNNSVAAFLKGCDQCVESRHCRRERRLEQEPPPAPEGQPLEFLARSVRYAGHCHLGSGDHLDRNSLVGEALVELRGKNARSCWRCSGSPNSRVASPQSCVCRPPQLRARARGRPQPLGGHRRCRGGCDSGGRSSAHFKT